MHLKTLFTLLALMIFCAVTANSQDGRCATKFADLPSIPELRGFRLGMTIDQVMARLPNAVILPADEFGLRSLNIFPDYEVGIDKSSFEGVRSISLEFVDDRVTSLWIGYDKSFKWQALDQFTSEITTALKLPNSWRTRFRNRLLDCADFSIAVVPVGESPSVKLADETARELVNKRKEAKEAAESLKP